MDLLLTLAANGIKGPSNVTPNMFSYAVLQSAILRAPQVSMTFHRTVPLFCRKDTLNYRQCSSFVLFFEQRFLRSHRIPYDEEYSYRESVRGLAFQVVFRFPDVFLLANEENFLPSSAEKHF